MNPLSFTLKLASGGLSAQASRLQHVSENIANADTPGYRRKIVSFQAEAETAGIELGKTWLDQSELKQVYDPAHPLADASGNYQGSNVNLVIEMADAREAQRSYEANLKMFKQARSMSSQLLDLLRR